MKEKDDTQITLSAKGRSVTVSGKDFDKLAKSFKRNQHSENCPKCKGANRRKTILAIGRVVCKCFDCGNIWGWDE